MRNKIDIIANFLYNIVITCKCLCILHAAILPSAAASTAVSAVPATSPPQNTPGRFVAIVIVSTFGDDPHESYSIPVKANFTSSDARVDPKAEIIKSHLCDVNNINKTRLKLCQGPA